MLVYEERREVLQPVKPDTVSTPLGQSEAKAKHIVSLVCNLAVILNELVSNGVVVHLTI